jgi:hypothetical protein
MQPKTACRRQARLDEGNLRRKPAVKRDNTPLGKMAIPTVFDAGLVVRVVKQTRN